MEAEVAQQEVLGKALKHAKEWQHSMAQASPRSGSSKDCASKAIQTQHPSDVYCCYSDAAWKGASSAGGMGWTFTNAAGCLLAAHFITVMIGCIISAINIADRIPGFEHRTSRLIHLACISLTWIVATAGAGILMMGIWMNRESRPECGFTNKHFRSLGGKLFKPLLFLFLLVLFQSCSLSACVFGGLFQSFCFNVGSNMDWGFSRGSSVMVGEFEICVLLLVFQDSPYSTSSPSLGIPIKLSLVSPRLLPAL
ncbi:hypothetical protein HID58_037468 [Brassica napus]|uniref:Uncharacterized protein n=1 Tax=Brassica napus TaxID=3708 RepID=A0ABQ8BLE1_BRANA|nr:hypothetical protein HID58_037468 [Brassica napus]